MITEFQGMTINAIHWLTAGYEPDTIGLIEITNAEGVRKVYCGAAVAGNDEETDVIQILQAGGKLHLRAIESLHRHLQPNQTKGDRL